MALITSRQAAARLEITDAQLKYLQRLGKLTIIHKGSRRKYFYSEEVEKLLKEKKPIIQRRWWQKISRK